MTVYLDTKPVIIRVVNNKSMSQEQLMVDYPMVVNDSVFNNGPSKYVSGGSSAKRDELCHSLNRGHTCPRFCKFIHRCNKEGYLGDHLGIRSRLLQSHGNQA